MIRHDILGRLLARRQITFSEYLAGRVWQEHMEAVELQRFRCYDWSIPLYSQPGLYQQSEMTDGQAYSSDVRHILRGEIGRVAADDLDRILGLPVTVKLKLSDQGVTYIVGLLRIVSIALDIQANGGDPFGPPAEDEVPDDEILEHRVRREQPWLFAPHRHRSGKISAGKVLGRQL